MTSATATPKQIDFIMSLVADRAERNNVPDAQALRDALVQQRLTKTGASAMIDTLLAQPKDAPKVDPAAQAERDARQAVSPGATSTHRTNNYQGKCGNCGVKVEARTGRIEKVSGRWVTYHLDGQCPTDLQTQLNELLADRPDGFFAVPFIGGDSHTDLTFFGIRTRGNGSGDRYVVHTVGGHSDTEDVSIAWTERALAALDTVDLVEAMNAYGTKMGHCGACGRHLTNVDSRRQGLGPDCASKL